MSGGVDLNDEGGVDLDDEVSRDAKMIAKAGIFDAVATGFQHMFQESLRKTPSATSASTQPATTDPKASYEVDSALAALRRAGSVRCVCQAQNQACFWHHRRHDRRRGLVFCRRATDMP